MERAYRYRNIDMLTASKVIVKSLKQNLDELRIVRTTWTESYANELEVKIDHAIETYVGLDKKKDQREATRSVKEILKTALQDLSFLRAQIDVDFREEAGEIKTTLGYTKNMRAAGKGDQEALVELLYRVKNGLTESLRAEMLSKGTNEELLNRIVDAATQMSDANTTQEGLKSSSKIVTHEMQVTYNDIYHEMIGICKVVSSYYQYNKLKKEEFTFSKVVGRMNFIHKEEDAPVDQGVEELES